MLVWCRVRWVVVCLVSLTGCWDEQRVDGVFSEDEWSYLQTFSIDRLPKITCSDARCERTAELGKMLFTDPSTSGAIIVASDAGAVGEVGKIACTRCHNPAGYFADKTPSSIGTGWTGRNVPGLVDLGYRTAYSWTGAYNRIGDVTDLALASKAAMNSDAARLVDVATKNYQAFYDQAFPGGGNAYDNAKYALGLYETQLVSGPSPFDRYLAGDFGAIDDAAKRGAKLFIGKALCSECHDGPLFATDNYFVTGVEQRGDRAAMPELGRDMTGRFRTPTLRHVAKTAPYMHAGQLETLAQVIELYRWGGDPGGFVGTKDERITPLDIDDDDVRDLEAFLLTLTGTPPDARWTVKP